MDNGSFSMSDDQIKQSIQSHVGRVVDVLKELYELCKRTHVCHGHGDYGSPLDYHGDLERKTQRIILDHLESSGDMSKYQEFAMLISGAKDIYIGRSGPQSDSYFATLIAAYKYNEFTRKAFKILVENVTFEKAFNVAKGYQANTKRGNDLYPIVGATKQIAVMIRAAERGA